MRQIERELLSWINNREQWSKGNTNVLISPNCDAEVFLFDNHLGTWSYTTDSFVVNRDTLRHWPTATTLSRLRALGVDVCQRKHVIHLDGEAL